MAIIFTGNDLDGIVATTFGDLWINAAGTTVANTVDAFSFGTTVGTTLLVAGTVASQSADAISSELTGGGLDIQVAATGIVLGGSDGIELEDDLHQVVNHGSITGLGDTGVEFLRDTIGGSRLINFGAIYGKGRAASASGNGNLIDNQGEMTGGGSGVELLSSNLSVVRNSGTILARSQGVLLDGASSTAINTLVNTGVISGDAAVLGSLGSEIVTNAGTMVGVVTLLEGADTVQNAGTIEGIVLLGEGDDVYRAIGGGVAQRVEGGAGGDALSGGAAADAMAGDDGDDELRGGGGEDALSGGVGNDRLFGGGEADALTGDAGNDALRGGAGDDVLSGGENSDLLLGGSGDDVLDGGRQNDRLAGGGGADVFVIGGNNGRDVILDFQRGVDTLDVSALGFATRAAALAAATTVDGNAVFTFGANQVTVLNITVGQIADDVSINALSMRDAVFVADAADGTWSDVLATPPGSAEAMPMAEVLLAC